MGIERIVLGGSRKGGKMRKGCAVGVLCIILFSAMGNEAAGCKNYSVEALASRGVENGSKKCRVLEDDWDEEEFEEFMETWMKWAEAWMRLLEELLEEWEEISEEGIEQWVKKKIGERIEEPSRSIEEQIEEFRRSVDGFLEGIKERFSGLFTGNTQKESLHEYIVIKTIYPPSVSEGQEFEVKIEVFSRLDSNNESSWIFLTDKSSWIFLTEENLKNITVFTSGEGLEIDEPNSDISFDYIVDKRRNPFVLFNLSTAGKLILSHSVPQSFDFSSLFSLLANAAGTGGSPHEWALEVGENYLLGLAEKINDDMMFVLKKNNLKPSGILSRRKTLLRDKKNVMVYHVRLKAPNHGGDYELTLFVEYSVLYYYNRGIIPPTTHKLQTFGNLEGMGSYLLGMSELNNFGFESHQAYETVVIHVRD